MDLAALLLILAVAVLVGLYISRPFASRHAAAEKLVRPAAEESEIRRSTLLSRAASCLTNCNSSNSPRSRGGFRGRTSTAKSAVRMHASI